MTGKIKHQRTCIGCGQTNHQNNFLRICFDGKKINISSHLNHKKEGRGAHICPNENCLRQAIKRNAFSHRLKTKIPPAAISDFSKIFLDNLKKQ